MIRKLYCIGLSVLNSKLCLLPFWGLLDNTTIGRLLTVFAPHLTNFCAIFDGEIVSENSFPAAKHIF